MQNAVGLDIQFGGDNNGVFVGGDNEGTVTVQNLHGKCQNLPVNFAVVVPGRDVGALVDYRDFASADHLLRLFTSSHTNHTIMRLPECNLAVAAGSPDHRDLFKTMMDPEAQQAPVMIEWTFCKSCQEYCCWAHVEHIVSYWEGNARIYSHDPANPVNEGFAMCSSGYAGPPADD